MGDAVVWSASSGRMLHWHRLTPEGAYSADQTFVAFHPGGERLAIAQRRDPVVEVEPLGDRRFRTLPARQPGRFYPTGPWRCLRYVGDALAVGTSDHLIVWRDESVRALHWPVGQFVAVSSDSAGTRLAGARARGVAVWEVPGGLPAGRRSRTFKVGDQVNAAALTPDGRTLLAGGDDWTVHVWDVDSGQKRAEYNWRLGQVTALVVSPDGMTAAVTGRKGPQVLIWDLE
jgi:WD40 repeat protein